MSVQTMPSVTHIEAPKDKSQNRFIVAHQHDGVIHAAMMTHVPFGGYVNFNVDVPCTVYFQNDSVFGKGVGLQKVLQKGDNFLDVTCTAPAETMYSFVEPFPSTLAKASPTAGPIVVVP